MIFSITRGIKKVLSKKMKNKILRTKMRMLMAAMLFLCMDIKPGIANTMDLPEKLLPRISSRMGIQRLCFGPYNHQQLQEIISSRLKGIDAFEKQAIEFASRKVSVLLFVS